MNKEQKYTSLELSKKIDELAKKKEIELESEYMWSEQMQGLVTRKWFLAQDPYNQDKLQDDGFRQAVETTYPALDTAELGEILPDGMQSNRIDNKDGTVDWHSWAWNFKHSFFAKTEAEARGKMFLYLLDNNLL